MGTEFLPSPNPGHCMLCTDRRNYILWAQYGQQGPLLKRKHSNEMDLNVSLLESTGKSDLFAPKLLLFVKLLENAISLLNALTTWAL